MKTFLASVICLYLLCTRWGSSFLTWPECESDDLMSCSVPVCPDCDLIDCIPELRPEQCPEGSFYRPRMAFGGCCPACVTFMERGESCDFEDVDQLERSLIPCLRNDSAHFYMFSDAMDELEDTAGLKIPLIHLAHCR